MKLLLDECVPRRLKNDLEGHNVLTVDEIGLKGVLDGEMLQAAAARNFDAVITVDRRIPFQQDISQFDFALIVLVARPCRYAELKLLIPATLEALRTIGPGQTVMIQ
jgi:predicted nuclease of predicted toxin-antitoxin system